MADTYPTGPPTQAGITSNWAPLPSDVGDIPAAALLAASDVAYKYASLFGFDKNVDWGRIIAGLAQSDTYRDPQQAYQWITYRSGQINSQMVQDEFPNILVGMTKDDYALASQKIQNAWSNLTGESLDSMTLQQAIKEGWSASDMQNYATYGDTRGAGYSRVPNDLSATPWLGSGTSFQQAQQSYVTATGHTGPVDKGTLASWWKFNQGAKQIGGSSMLGPTSEAAPGSQAAQFSRQPQDTEVR